MANVVLRDVRKTYAGGFEAIKGIDFEVGDGQFCVLVGPCSSRTHDEFVWRPRYISRTYY